MSFSKRERIEEVCLTSALGLPLEEIGFKDKKGKVQSLLEFVEKSDCSHFFVKHLIHKASLGQEIEIPVLGREGNYGWETRHMTRAEKPGWCIVGCDASGIQLRALAHFMGDPEYTRQVLDGDIHTYNQEMAGFATRKQAKRFIYAFLLGAGDVKIGEIAEVQGTDEDKRRAGAELRARFLSNLPALDSLIKSAHKAAKKGYMIGLSGAPIPVPSKHLSLTAYLQGFEADVMMLSMCYWTHELKKKGIPFRLVAYVHDEWQVETPEEYADIVGETMVESFKRAEKKLNVNIRLDGAYLVGESWSECH